jgi:hypothetical protein
MTPSQGLGGRGLAVLGLRPQAIEWRPFRTFQTRSTLILNIAIQSGLYTPRLKNNDGVTKKPLRMESKWVEEGISAFVKVLDEADRKKIERVIKAIDKWNDGKFMMRIVPNDWLLISSFKPQTWLVKFASIVGVTLKVLCTRLILALQL